MAVIDDLDVARGAKVDEAVATAAGKSPEEEDGDALHIVSWNVAGWKTTCEQIGKQPGGLTGFLERHHADVLCLQETKLATKAIAEESRAIGAEIPGYESFWARNEGAAGQRKGLDGVCTIARQGTVIRADAAPLGAADLDGEGRCLLTDHGCFVVFNVYVPNNSGGPRLPYKLRWLKALRAAMRREREAGKAVILTGDLNMKHGPSDLHWSFRRVTLAALTRLAGGAATAVAGDEEVHDVAAKLVRFWPAVCEALAQKEVRPMETRNSATGQAFSKFGIWVPVQEGDKVKHIRIGSPCDTEGHARGSFSLAAVGVQEDGVLLFGAEATAADYLCTRAGELCVGDLAECFKKIAGVDVTMNALKLVSDRIGSSPQAPPVQEWFDAAISEDGLADSFLEFHGGAEERFTCWEQYRNRRTENVGTRLDYFLVDRAFLAKHGRRGLDLATGEAKEKTGRLAADSAAAALHATTLGGRSQPSSFAGGGMAALEADEYALQFRPGPATGMLYTPPQLSDHIAVSLLLHGVPRPGAVVTGAKDAKTRASQPHKTVKRISDFFMKAKKPQATSGAEAPAAKRSKFQGS